ncbi:hypothetical protein J6590_002352, partial [Homalodisca vitripennis]
MLNPSTDRRPSVRNFFCALGYLYISDDWVSSRDKPITWPTAVSMCLQISPVLGWTCQISPFALRESVDNSLIGFFPNKMGTSDAITAREETSLCLNLMSGWMEGLGQPIIRLY